MQTTPLQPQVAGTCDIQDLCSVCVHHTGASEACTICHVCFIDLIENKAAILASLNRHGTGMQLLALLS